MHWQPINEFDFDSTDEREVVFNFSLLGPRLGYNSVSGWRYHDHYDGHIMTYLIQDMDHAIKMGITHFFFIDPIQKEE